MYRECVFLQLLLQDAALLAQASSAPTIKCMQPPSLLDPNDFQEFKNKNNRNNFSLSSSCLLVCGTNTSFSLFLLMCLISCLWVWVCERGRKRTSSQKEVCSVLSSEHGEVSKWLFLSPWGSVFL